MGLGSIGSLVAMLELRDQFSGPARQAVNSAKALGAQVAVAGTAVAAIGGALFKVASSTAIAGDEFQKMSLRTGIGAAELSKLGFAANLAGTDIESVEKGLARAARVISDASAGLKTAQRPFEKLGIDIRDSSGALISVGDLLPQVADKLKTLGSETERAATLQELFGRSGTQLLPLLSQGSDAIRAQMLEAEKLGLVFDDVAANKSAEFVDAQTRVKAAFDGLRNAFALQFMPAFTGGLDTLATRMAGFRDQAAAAGQAVGQKLVPFLITAGEKILGLATFLANNIDNLVRFGKALAIAFAARALINFAQASVGAISALRNLAAAQAGGAVGAARWTAALTSPAGLIAALSAAAIAADFGAKKIGEWIVKQAEAAATASEMAQVQQSVRTALGFSTDEITRWVSGLDRSIQALIKQRAEQLLARGTTEELAVKYRAMIAAVDNAQVSTNTLSAEFQNLFGELTNLNPEVQNTDGQILKLTASMDLAAAAMLTNETLLARQRTLFQKVAQDAGAYTREFTDLSSVTVEWADVSLPKTVPSLKNLKREADAAKTSAANFFATFTTGIPAIDGFLGKMRGVIGVIGSLASALSNVGGGLGGFFGKLSGSLGGAGGGSNIFGGLLSGIKGLFSGGGAGESVINVAAQNAGTLMSGGLATAGATGAGGLLSGLTGVLGKAANFLPVVGPLLAAFGGPLFKGLKALGGKIVGFFSGLFGGVSAAEKAGRASALSFKTDITSILDATQKAEAGTDSWKLSVIAIRDAFLATGKSEQQAMDAANALWAAEKQGAAAVEQVIKTQLAPSFAIIQAEMDKTGQTFTQVRNRMINDAMAVKKNVVNEHLLMAREQRKVLVNLQKQLSTAQGKEAIFIQKKIASVKATIKTLMDQAKTDATQSVTDLRKNTLPIWTNMRRDADAAFQGFNPLANASSTRPGSGGGGGGGGARGFAPSRTSSSSSSADLASEIRALRRVLVSDMPNANGQAIRHAIQTAGLRR